jgi:hypothetical protein
MRTQSHTSERADWTVASHYETVAYVSPSNPHSNKVAPNVTPWPLCSYKAMCRQVVQPFKLCIETGLDK